MVYLDPARVRPNLTIASDAQVRWLKIEGRRVTEVIYEQNGAVATAQSDTVVLSAGVYHSPQILLLSGVGPEHQLTGMGIPVMHGLPGVGEKVADCVLLFSLEKLEAFPVDVWVRRTLEERYLGGEKRPAKALAAWARDRFGRHGGYAQQYLFHQKRLEG